MTNLANESSRTRVTHLQEGFVAVTCCVDVCQAHTCHSENAATGREPSHCPPNTRAQLLGEMRTTDRFKDGHMKTQ